MVFNSIWVNQTHLRYRADRFRIGLNPSAISSCCVIWIKSAIGSSISWAMQGTTARLVALWPHGVKRHHWNVLMSCPYRPRNPRHLRVWLSSIPSGEPLQGEERASGREGDCGTIVTRGSRVPVTKLNCSRYRSYYKDPLVGIILWKCLALALVVFESCRAFTRGWV